MSKYRSRLHFEAFAATPWASDVVRERINAWTPRQCLDYLAANEALALEHLGMTIKEVED